MKKINCSRIVTLYDAHRNLIDALREQGSDLAFTVEEMPPISYAFPKLGHEIQADLFIPYPHSASRPDQNRPSIYIHSSGSTGFPKAIPQSYKVQIHWMYHSAPIRLLLDLGLSYIGRYGSHDGIFSQAVSRRPCWCDSTASFSFSRHNNAIVSPSRVSRDDRCLSTSNYKQSERNSHRANVRQYSRWCLSHALQGGDNCSSFIGTMGRFYRCRRGTSEAGSSRQCKLCFVRWHS